MIKDKDGNGKTKSPLQHNIVKNAVQFDNGVKLLNYV